MISDLDWSNWWTDNSFGQHYLHVADFDGAWHRVHYRDEARMKPGVTPRLGSRKGKLFWVIGEHVDRAPRKKKCPLCCKLGHHADACPNQLKMPGMPEFVTGTEATIAP